MAKRNRKGNNNKNWVKDMKVKKVRSNECLVQRSLEGYTKEDFTIAWSIAIVRKYKDQSHSSLRMN
jgi:hypothetical protein